MLARRQAGLPYVSLIWHPWSLHQADPQMRMIEAVVALGLGKRENHEAGEFLADRQGPPSGLVGSCPRMIHVHQLQQAQAGAQKGVEVLPQSAVIEDNARSAGRESLPTSCVLGVYRHRS